MASAIERLYRRVIDCEHAPNSIQPLLRHGLILGAYAGGARALER